MFGPINRLIGLVYDRLPAKVQDEIVVATLTALTVIDLFQETAIPAPLWVHDVILAVSVLAGALGIRGSVTPLSKQ